MTRGQGLILVTLSALIAFAAGWVAWNGIQVYKSDLCAGVVVDGDGAWAWRNW